jgi:hypothetical protein
MSTEDSPEEFKKKLNALKPKKKKLAVPEGFLDQAKSYEGKVEAVKIISEREKDRVILIFKKLLEPEPPRQQIEPPADVKPKEPPKKKGLFGKK